jgi:PrgI family protein
MWTSLTPAGDRPSVSDTSLLRAKIPGDLDAPDRLAFDLTFRQLAVLAIAGVTGLFLWALLARAVPMVPPAARAVPMIPIAGTALALAVGRRDGLPLDAWLLAAAVFRHRPHRLFPVPVVEPPDWAPAVVSPPDASRDQSRGDREMRPPGLLRLPADALDPDGTLHRPDRSSPSSSSSSASGSATVLVAATTVNVTLRTPAEQAGLVAGLGRWLNSLTTSVQIVVSTRRVDLPAHAVRIADRAHTLTDAPTDGLTDDGMDGDAADPVAGSGLAAAALDHAEFLLDLTERLDPLARTVTIAATATGGPSPATVARRTAEHTVTALTALGAEAVVLDGPAATAVLTAATDPYQAGDASWSRTPPGDVVTGRPPRNDGRDVVARETWTKGGRA